MISGLRRRAWRFLAINPEGRVYASGRWDAAMLVCGILMVVGNAVSAAYGGAGLGPAFRWSLAVVGLAVTLTALSDLLFVRGGAGSGARRAALGLRSAVQASYSGVILWWVWAAANGGGAARFALASGLAAVVLFYWFRWAREADRRDASRSGDL